MNCSNFTWEALAKTDCKLGEKRPETNTGKSHAREDRNARDVWVALLRKTKKVRGKEIKVVDEPGAVWFFSFST
jgi:hypothetical protein